MKLVLLYLISVATAAILGIDLGHKFTKAILLAPGVSFEPVLTNEGKRKDSSELLIRQHPDSKDELERFYGSSVGSLCTRFPKNCLVDLKAILGKPFEELADFKHQHFFKIVPDDSRLNGFKIDTGVGLFSVEEAIAMCLNNIKTRALVDLENNPQAVPTVEDVAIAIPPFVTQETRQAYLDVLYLSNFSNILGIFDEGTAVALNYVTNTKLTKEDLSTGEKEYNIIYDIGAGSTKATLFSFTPSSFGSAVLEIENIGFDESLGGQLFTNEIYQVLIESFRNKFSLSHDTEISNKIRARIMEAAEKAKLVLSANTDYYVSLESLYDEKDFKVTISRDQFEELISEYGERVVKPILKAKGELPFDKINSIILTGGSTRVPFVLKHLTTLVGEDKISKNVNADESCALGTTNLGFKHKSTLGKANDISIIDKAFHTYSIEVNGIEKQIYSYASVIGNQTSINFSQLTNSSIGDDINLDIFEDGNLIKTYTIEGKSVTAKSDKLKCKKRESKNLVGLFTLDNNKIFSLNGLTVECVKSEKEESKGGLFKNMLGKKFTNDDDNDDDEEEGEEEEEQQQQQQEAQEAEKSPLGEDGETNNDFEDIENEKHNANATNSTTKAKKAKASKYNIIKSITLSIPKPVFARVKPLSGITKERMFKKLGDLNSRDEYRYQVDQVKNILEGQCYELRSYIDEFEDQLTESISDITPYTNFASELIEWLEFDSDGSSIKDFQKKISELNKKKKELDNILHMHTVDLSFDGIKKLYEEGTETVMSIQKNLLEYGQSISELREKFEKDGFDFEKENNRIKTQLLTKSGGIDKMMSLDKNLARYREVLTELGELIELDIDEFNKLSRDKLYEIYQRISGSIMNMMEDINDVSTSHNERVTLFENKLKKLLDRKAKKEFRDKLKQEQKQKQKADEKKESQQEQGNDEKEKLSQDQQTKQDVEEHIEEHIIETSSAIENATETEVTHDEL